MLTLPTVMSENALIIHLFELMEFFSLLFMSSSSEKHDLEDSPVHYHYYNVLITRSLLLENFSISNVRMFETWYR